MTVASLVQTGPRGWIKWVWKGVLHGSMPRPACCEKRSIQADRAFLLEMLDRHPEAFSSPSDLPSMYGRPYGRF